MIFFICIEDLPFTRLHFYIPSITIHYVNIDPFTITVVLHSSGTFVSGQICGNNTLFPKNDVVEQLNAFMTSQFFPLIMSRMNVGLQFS